MQQCVAAIAEMSSLLNQEAPREKIQNGDAQRGGNDALENGFSALQLILYTLSRRTPGPQPASEPLDEESERKTA
jgi:hypothetical protein